MLRIKELVLIHPIWAHLSYGLTLLVLLLILAMSGCLDKNGINNSNSLAFDKLRDNNSERPLINSLDGHVIWNETRFLEKPLHPFTLSISGEDYVNSFTTLSLDENGIIVMDYGEKHGGAGRQYNPFIISNYALALYRDYRSAGNLSSLDSFKKQAKWFFDHRTQREYQGSEFWVWEYNFDDTFYEAKAPWISSLAQGNALCVFMAAYDLTNDKKYLHAAECSFRSFCVPVSGGGISTFKDNMAWYEEVANEEAPSSKILNGHIIAVQSLWTFWKWTGREDAKRYLDLGISAVKKDIALYDAGFLSYYSQYPANPRILANPGGYNKLHSRQLVWLYEVTGEPVFLKYALRFASCEVTGWKITTAGSSDPTGHGPKNLFFKKGDVYWSHNRFPTWVKLDLKSSQIIEGVVLYGYSLKTIPRDFQVFISEDDKIWTQIVERYGNKEQCLIERFEPIQARFVKIVILADNGSNNTELKGVAVVREDVSPTAVSDWNSSSSGDLATRIFNNGWNIPKKGWIIADLGKPTQDIIIEAINATNQGPFAIFGTNDLKTFDAIALPTVQQNKNGSKVVLQKVRSKYLKIEFNEGYKGGKLLIRRLQ